MKRTLTINLDNIVFHIDEDAYNLLENYLHEIEQHFEADTARKEIMSDIENRIAEILTEQMVSTKNVVNTEDVEKIMQIMGKPEDFIDNDSVEDKHQENQRKKYRKLYRNPHDALLGGIASGLTAYFGWKDAIWIRLTFALMFFLSYSFVIPIYIILWIVMPKAITQKQQLEMRGEPIDLTSIRSNKSDDNQIPTQSGFRNLLKFLLKFTFGIIVALFGLIALFTIIVTIFALLMSLGVLVSAPFEMSFPLFSFVGEMNRLPFFIGIVSVLLLMAIPIYAVVHWRRNAKKATIERISHTPYWVALAIWVASVIALVFVVNSFRSKHLNTNAFQSVSYGQGTYSIEQRYLDLEPYDEIEVGDVINLVLVQGTDSEDAIRIEGEFSDLDNLITKVENETLKIYFDNDSMRGKTVVQVPIHTKSIVVKGEQSATIYNNDPLVLDKLHIDVKDNCTVTLTHLDIKKTDIKASGSTTLTLQGKTNSLDVSTSDNAQMEAMNYHSQVAHFKLKDNSKVVAFVEGKYDCVQSDTAIFKEAHQ